MHGFLVPVVVFLTVFLGACGDDASPEPQVDAGGDAYVAPTECDVDGGVSCDNGVHCDGIETCNAADPNADPVTHCVPGTEVVCDDGIDCTTDTCDETVNDCTFTPPDEDEDGSYDIACLDDNDEPLGDDCDDGDATRHPGNPEVCTPGNANATRDEDCNDTTFGSRDEDNDGREDLRCCNPDSTGTLSCGDDCDDSEMTVYPGAGELCDMLDNDCDTMTDESPQDADWYPDTDRDGFGDPNGTIVTSCAPVSNHSLMGTDCDDTRAGVNPGNPEICDGLDNDCSSDIDDDIFCGACLCSLTNVAAVSCTSGPSACTIGVCNQEFLNCDSDQTNGCESDRRTDTSCGQCGKVCDANATCGASGGAYDCGCDAPYAGDGITCSLCSSGYTGIDGVCTPTLTGLALSSGTLSPALMTGTTAYTARVGIGTQTITLTPTAVSGTTITIDGAAVVSGSSWTSPTLTLGDNLFTIVVRGAENSSGNYTLIVTRGIDQEAYIKASNTSANSGFGNVFGSSVALSGDGNTLAVGSPAETSRATGINGNQNDDTGYNNGAVYVFTRSDSVWIQQAYVKGSNTDDGNSFGQSIALSHNGDTLAVGASAEDSSATGINGDQTNNDAYGSGAVYVFTRASSAWSQQAYIKASNTEVNDNFGWSVTLSGDGNTLAVGAVYEKSNATGINGDDADNSASHSGAVFVFTRVGSAWSQQAYVKASNTEEFDNFGESVALSSDGGTLAVGAGRESSNAIGINGDETNNDASGSGAAYVFTRVGSAWSQQAYVKASNTESGDRFGRSVALSGDGSTLAVGADLEDSDINGSRGAAYVFTRSSGLWSEQAIVKASITGAGDQFGYSIALSGDGSTLAVGAYTEDSNATGINGSASNNSADSSGAVYVFTRAGGVWSQRVYVKASNTGTDDRFGGSLAISSDGGTLAVGSYNEDSNATGIDGDETDNSETNSGAVYVFR